MYFVFYEVFCKKNYKQELQALNELMPVPGPDDDMLVEDRQHLPDWGEWLASGSCADAIEKLGTPTKTI